MKIMFSPRISLSFMVWQCKKKFRINRLHAFSIESQKKHYSIVCIVAMHSILAIETSWGRFCASKFILRTIISRQQDKRNEQSE